MADGEVIPDALRLQQALEVAGPERDSAPSYGAIRSVADEDETPDFYLAGTDAILLAGQTSLLMQVGSTHCPVV